MNHPFWPVLLFFTGGRFANREAGHYSECEHCAKSLLVEMVDVMRQSPDPKAFIAQVTGKS